MYLLLEFSVSLPFALRRKSTTKYIGINKKTAFYKKSNEPDEDA